MPFISNKSLKIYQGDILVFEGSINDIQLKNGFSNLTGRLENIKFDGVNVKSGGSYKIEIT